jgi:hypothetical protein
MIIRETTEPLRSKKITKVQFNQAGLQIEEKVSLLERYIKSVFTLVESGKHDLIISNNEQRLGAYPELQIGEAYDNQMAMFRSPYGGGGVSQILGEIINQDIRQWVCLTGASLEELLRRAMDIKVSIRMISTESSALMVLDNYKIRDLKTTPSGGIVVSNISNSVQFITDNLNHLNIFDFLPSLNHWTNSGTRGEIRYVSIYSKKHIKIKRLGESVAEFYVKKFRYHAYESDSPSILFGDISDERLQQVLGRPDLLDSRGAGLSLLKEAKEKKTSEGLDDLLEWVLERESSLEKTKKARIESNYLGIWRLQSTMRATQKRVELSKVKVSGAYPFPQITNEQLFQLKSAMIDKDGIMLPKTLFGTIPWDGVLSINGGVCRLSLGDQIRERGE